MTVVPPCVHCTLPGGCCETRGRGRREVDTLILQKHTRYCSPSLVPRPPFNPPKKKGALVTTFLELPAVQSDWLMLAIISLYCASLPQTTWLYSSHLYRPTYTPSNLLKPSKQLCFQQNPQHLASPCCEDVQWSVCVDLAKCEPKAVHMNIIMWFFSHSA